METLSYAESMDSRGGMTKWGDVFLGALYATDLVCAYTKNLWVCGAALVGHGTLFLISLD